MSPEEINKAHNSSQEAKDLNMNAESLHNSDERVEYIFFLNLVYERFGFNLGGYNETFLRRRLDIRLKQKECTTYANYFQILISDREEYDLLIQELGINVSEFFRDPGMWNSLIEKVLPDVFYEGKTLKDDHFSFWSSACNTGDEPYSLSILIKEYLNNRDVKTIVQVYASDIKEEFIEEAKKLCFSKERVKNVGSNLIKKYFVQNDEEKYVLNQDIGNMVQFKHMDLLSEISFPLMNIIFCRNVLIYFNKEAQSELLTKFHKILKPKGYLVLGKVEGLNEKVSTLFRAVDNAERIYQKI